MEQKYKFVIAVIVAIMAIVVVIPKRDKDFGSLNVQRAEKLAEDVFPFIALIEGDNGCNGAYYCGARWTVQYGVTVKPDGSFVKKGNKVSNADAKKWCIHHIKKRVVPFFVHFDKRKLTDNEILMAMLFIYNVGGEAVTGYDLLGNKRSEPCRFFHALNDGKNIEYVANCMTGFRKSAGRRANGLLKRHWVAGAVGMGILTEDNVKDLKPCQFYVTKNLGNYYFLDKKRNLIKKNDLFQLRYDDITINCFFNMNEAKDGEKSLRDIIP